MCGCATEHGGSACGSAACHCHEQPVPEGFKRTTLMQDHILAFQDEEVYLSISFPKVSRRKAIEIERMLLSVAGLISYNVYINDDPDEETDED